MKTRSSYTFAVMTLATGLASSAAAAQDQVPIKMVIAQTPWYPAFEQVVGLYEEQTGNKVELDVNPSPALMDKVRSSVRATAGEFDVLSINALTLPEYYYGGYVAPLTQIDPAFKLDGQIIPYGGTAQWDPKKKVIGEGDVYGVPINGNIQLLYYRKDLYDKAGLSVPKTWEDLYKNAEALKKQGGAYPMVIRGNRSFADSSYDFYPYLRSYGGSFYERNQDGSYKITANSPQALAALDMWTKLAKIGAPDAQTINQAKMIELLATGKAAQSGMVAAAWPQLEDENKSLVVGKMAVAPLPAGPDGAVTPLGHWLAGVSVNIPQDRQKAAVAFLNWFQQKETQQRYVEFGGIPVRTDTYAENEKETGPNRWMGAMRESAKMGVSMFEIPEGVQMIPQIELRLQQVLIGEKSNAQALNELANDVDNILKASGNKTERLQPLP